MILASRLPCAACAHWKIAECSESTGRILTPFSRAARMTSSPAHTSVSLLASAMSLPASIAASVGSRPTMPTTAVTTISAPLSAAQAVRPSMPVSTRISVSASLTLRSRAAASSNATHHLRGCSRSAPALRVSLRGCVVNRNFVIAPKPRLVRGSSKYQQRVCPLLAVQRPAPRAYPAPGIMIQLEMAVPFPSKPQLCRVFGYPDPAALAAYPGYPTMRAIRLRSYIGGLRSPLYRYQMIRNRISANGATNSTLSNRSSTPPWPGKIWP